MAVKTNLKNSPSPISLKNPSNINKIKSDILEINKSVDQLTRKLEDLFSKKSAKLICLLRLDMVADKLEDINPELARRIDEVTTDLERAEEE